MEYKETRRAEFGEYWQAIEELAKKKAIFAVVIGANDGKSNDPIYDLAVKHKMSGIAVEPQPALFERLKENYAGLDFDCKNVAIGVKCGRRKLYYIKPSILNIGKSGNEMSSIRRNYEGAASFSKAQTCLYLQKHMAEEHLGEMDVDVLDMETLLTGVKSVDILQVDIEGYDWMAIKGFDFEKFNPNIVLYESGHLWGRAKSRYELCEKILSNAGYSIKRMNYNTLAIKDMK